jgi:hypothetical protein
LTHKRPKMVCCLTDRYWGFRNKRQLSDHSHFSKSPFYK